LVKFLQGFVPDPKTGKPTTQPVDPGFPQSEKELQNLIKTGPGTSRMLVLYFQSHVDPGSSPNQMTGVRVQVTGTTTRDDVEQAGDTWQTARVDEHGQEVQVKVAGPSLVKVLRLHPTRNYDVESVAFGESLKQALALTGKITAPLKVADINASGARKAGLDAEERRRFLSRIGKAASFADATNHEFGWNYYPSNLQVVRPGAFEYVFQWLFGTPRAYKVQAYMEGGARDSVAVLLVPRNLHSIRCRVWTFAESLNPNTGSGSKRLSARDTREFEIILPKWNDYEIAAAALGVFTKTSSTQMVK